MKRLISVVLPLALLAAPFVFANMVSAAPSYTIERTIIPETHNTYNLGATSTTWAHIYGGVFHGNGSQLTGISGTFTTTTVNGLSSTAYTFAAGANVSSIDTTAPGTITINVATSSGAFTTTTIAVATSTLSSTGYTFSTSTDTNLALRLSGSGSTIFFNPVWIGTLADDRITSAATWNAKATPAQIYTAWGQDLYSTSSPTFAGLTVGSLNGLLKGTSGVLGTATAGTDYVATSTGDWLGTFDGQEGTWYIARANHTGTQLANTISNFGPTVYGLLTFSTSGASGLQIASSSGTWTWSQTTSSATTNGFLSSADWGTFNGKQNTITFPIPVASTSLAVANALALNTNTLNFTGSFATSGASNIRIASSSGNSWTISQATSTASVNGFLSAADFTTFNNKQNAITFPIPVASTSLTARSPLTINANQIYFAGTFTQTPGQVLISSSSPTWTFSLPQTIYTTSTVTFEGVNFTNATGTNITASGFTSSTNAKFNAATTTNQTATNLYFAGDSTKLTTASETSSFNVINATTTPTATTTIQKQTFKAITLSQVTCSTNGSNATISADIRASSTPNTQGTSIGGNMLCTSTGFSTTTFANANLSALQVLNFNLVTLANSTTTIRVNFKYKEQ